MNKYPRRDAITAGAEADHSEQTLFTASPQSFQLIGRGHTISATCLQKLRSQTTIPKLTHSILRTSKQFETRGHIAAGVFARFFGGKSSTINPKG